MGGAALRALVLAAVAGLTGVSAAAAQDDAPASAILTVDPERLFEGSGVAERVSREIELRRAELAAENRRIEEELTAEELDLTERRPTLDPEDFRALADAFDEKVQGIREEQDAKLRDLQRRMEEERQDFLRRISPVLAEIVRERGAVVVLDRRSVFISAEAIDITEEAIARVNSFLAPAPGQDPAPGSDPAPGPPPDSAPEPAAPED